MYARFKSRCGEQTSHLGHNQVHVVFDEILVRIERGASVLLDAPLSAYVGEFSVSKFLRIVMSNTLWLSVSLYVGKQGCAGHSPALGRKNKGGSSVRVEKKRKYVVLVGEGFLVDYAPVN